MGRQAVEKAVESVHERKSDSKVQLFRVEVSAHRTDYVVTNDLAQDS
jgi:hypothetical protein